MDRRDDLVCHHSSPEAKIALFRSLFRGRDDVYPRRFENRRSGKSGYQPGCANEWVRGVCENPKGQVRRVPTPPLSAGHRRSDRLAPFRKRWCQPGFCHGQLANAPEQACFFLRPIFSRASGSGSTQASEAAHPFRAEAPGQTLPLCLDVH